jgi:4-amino-4-deoxy-L-arabinose transferase-like glycosyltransferase
LALAALDALLLLPTPDGLKTWAALGLGVLLPGWLLVKAFAADDAPTWPLRLLYGVGAGYALFVVSLLGLSYLPGGLTFRQVFVTFHLVSAGLAVAATVARRGQVRSTWPRLHWNGATLALLALLAGAAYLRFTHLGYAELHGDETLVALRAVDVIQGYERALFVHKKGPAEILIGAGIYVLTGKLSEFAAHLPFALASFAGVAAVYALARRWFGPVAGWWAAGMVAVDGYLMAFGRMLQYQSIVFLMVVLTALAMQDSVDRPQRAGRSLLLAALFAATGLLAHYEGVLAGVPALWLLICLFQASTPGRVLRQLALPLGLGIGLLLVFYVPFVLDPEFFADTFAYVFGHRLAGSVEPEGLAIIVGRTTLYGSSYYFWTLVVLALVGLGWVYGRFLPRLAALVWGLLLAGMMAALLVNAPAFFALPFRLGLIAFGLLFAPAWLARGMGHGERAVWLWFGAALIFVLFFVRKPGTHVYVFFIPWALVAGMVVGRLWEAATRRAPASRYALVPLSVAALVVFGYYVHRLFVVNNPEVLRTWDENRPAGYWTSFATPTFESIFGFPLRSGWKTVAAIYAQGTLHGRLDTNDRFFMTVPDWYLRGEAFCGRDEPNYYVLVPHPLPVDRSARDDERSRLTDKYYLWGVVTANSAPELEIWARQDRVAAEMAGSPRTLADEEYTRFYNTNLLSPYFLRNGPVGAVEIPNPIDVRFGDAIHLLGYSVDRAEVAPGGEVEVELYWRTDVRLTTNYFVSLQVLDSVTAGKAGQRDSEPGCNRVPTTRWTPGDRIFDRYIVPIAADAVGGTYQLALIVYTDQGALSVTGADGQVSGSAVLVPLTVTP